ncbi:hypothetical protein, partial [Comamonas thiooxydans]|uniref:hypothetical protein n=1 Tax=Comamonas thiooxydans TaxID=363952 RepID=UPI0019D700AE
WKNRGLVGHFWVEINKQSFAVCCYWPKLVGYMVARQEPDFRSSALLWNEFIGCMKAKTLKASTFNVYFSVRLEA